MHLSEWTIAAQDTVNPYQVHRHLWKAFPGMPDADRPFLFRFDRPVRHGPGKALMLSTVEPLQPDDADVCMLRAAAFQPGFEAGQRLLFSLRANPVKMLKHDKNRVPLTRHEDLLEWLDRKLEKCARVVHADIAGRQALHFKKGRRPGKIVAVDFEGLLEVRHPEALRQALFHGLGPAKAFGCGMLLVRRA